MIKKQSLEESIYMVCFSQPRYTYEIVKILYKEEKRRHTMRPKITTKVKKMVNDGSLIVYSGQKIGEGDDGRSKTRKYYYATSTPILNDIINKVEINKNEKRRLKPLLEEESFRSILEYEIGWDSIDKITNIIGHFAVSSIMIVGYGKHLNPTMKMKSEQMVKQTRNIKKDISNKFTDQYEKIRSDIAVNITKNTHDLKPTKQQRANITTFSKKFLKLGDPLIEKLMSLSYDKQVILEFIIDSLAVSELVTTYKIRYKQTQ